MSAGFPVGTRDAASAGGPVVGRDAGSTGGLVVGRDAGSAAGPMSAGSSVAGRLPVSAAGPADAGRPISAAGPASAGAPASTRSPVRVGLVTNEASRRGRAEGFARQALQAIGRHGGIDVLVLDGRTAGEKQERARHAATTGAIDALIAVGGDGTVHIGVQALTGTGLPLGIVPVGSGNDIARQFALPVGDVERAVERAVACLRSGLTTPVDIMEIRSQGPSHRAGAAYRTGPSQYTSPSYSAAGQADTSYSTAAARHSSAAGQADTSHSTAATDHPGEPDRTEALHHTGEPRHTSPATRQAATHYALAIASFGLDAAINLRANGLAWPCGNLRYLRAALAELRRFTPYGLRLEVDGQAASAPATLVSVANTSYFGGGLQIAPMADPSDGLLDVVYAKDLPKAEICTLFPRLYSGSHLRHPNVHTRRARHVKICAAPEFGQAPPPVMADGDVMGRLPVEVRCLPRSLELLA